MNDNLITQNVVFELSDYEIIKNLQIREGYGGKGFSAALRKIIREWNAQRLTPAQQVVEELRGEMS